MYITPRLGNEIESTASETENKVNTNCVDWLINISKIPKIP